MRVILNRVYFCVKERKRERCVCVCRLFELEAAVHLGLGVLTEAVFPIDSLSLLCLNGKISTS